MEVGSELFDANTNEVDSSFDFEAIVLVSVSYWQID